MRTGASPKCCGTSTAPRICRVFARSVRTRPPFRDEAPGPPGRRARARAGARGACRLAPCRMAGGPRHALSRPRLRGHVGRMDGGPLRPRRLYLAGRGSRGCGGSALASPACDRCGPRAQRGALRRWHHARVRPPVDRHGARAGDRGFARRRPACTRGAADRGLRRRMAVAPCTHAGRHILRPRDRRCGRGRYGARLRHPASARSRLPPTRADRRRGRRSAAPCGGARACEGPHPVVARGTAHSLAWRAPRDAHPARCRRVRRYNLDPVRRVHPRHRRRCTGMARVRGARHRSCRLHPRGRGASQITWAGVTTPRA